MLSIPHFQNNIVMKIDQCDDDGNKENNENIKLYSDENGSV